MGNFIDMGFCKEDDPIFTEGISVFTVRRLTLPPNQQEESRLRDSTRKEELPDQDEPLTGN